MAQGTFQDCGIILNDDHGGGDLSEPDGTGICGRYLKEIHLETQIPHFS